MKINPTRPTNKLIVSISLGPSSRNHSSQALILNQPFEIKRIGCDGNLNRAIELIKQFDGRASAIGLGGIDFYLRMFNRKWHFSEAIKLKQIIKRVPLTDGSNYKSAIEPEIPEMLNQQINFDISKQKVFFVCALNRFPLALALEQAGAVMTYGDFISALKINFPVHSLKSGSRLAALTLPLALKLPYHYLYPVESANKSRPSKSRPWLENYYHHNDIIAGDFNYLKKYAPERLDGKIIITTSVLPQDKQLLIDRGVKILVTTSPIIGDRAWGANVVDAIIAAFAGKWPLSILETQKICRELNLLPQISRLN